MAMQTPFSPLSFGKSFMKIRSAVPENGYLVFFCGGRKKTKKAKKQNKTSVKHIRILLIGGCVNQALRRPAAGRTVERKNLPARRQSYIAD